MEEGKGTGDDNPRNPRRITVTNLVDGCGTVLGGRNRVDYCRALL